MEDVLCSLLKTCWPLPKVEPPYCMLFFIDSLKTSEPVLNLALSFIILSRWPPFISERFTIVTSSFGVYFLTSLLSRFVLISSKGSYLSFSYRDMTSLAAAFYASSLTSFNPCSSEASCTWLLREVSGSYTLKSSSPLMTEPPTLPPNRPVKVSLKSLSFGF